MPLQPADQRLRTAIGVARRTDAMMLRVIQAWGAAYYRDGGIPVVIPEAASGKQREVAVTAGHLKHDACP